MRGRIILVGLVILGLMLVGSFVFRHQEKRLIIAPNLLHSIQSGVDPGFGFTLGRNVDPAFDIKATKNVDPKFLEKHQLNRVLIQV